MMYGRNLGGLLLHSLFVAHLTSVTTREILKTWERKSLKKECVYPTSCYFILISYSDRGEKHFKLRTFFLIRKMCLAVNPLTTIFLYIYKYNDIICQDWGNSCSKPLRQRKNDLALNYILNFRMSYFSGEVWCWNLRQQESFYLRA